MTNNLPPTLERSHMAISNLLFQANQKQWTLTEVLEIARKDIVERIEKYQLNSLSSLGAISSIATANMEGCIRQRFLEHTKFFINDYDVLDDPVKTGIREKISFEIKNNWLHVKARPHGIYLPNKLYQSKRISDFSNTRTIFETDETIDFNKDSFCELAEAVFGAANGKIREKIAGFLNASSEKIMLPDDQIRSEIRRNCILNDKLLAETFFVTAIRDHTLYIPGKEIVNIIINKLSGIKGIGTYETMADILLEMMPENLSFSINSFNKESFDHVDLSLVPYREKYTRYHRGELALFGQHLFCFHIFNFVNGPVFMVGPHELVEQAAFLEQNRNKTSLILEDAFLGVDIEEHHRFTGITLERSEPARSLQRLDLPIISFPREKNLESEPENELLKELYVKPKEKLERVPMDGNVEEASAEALNKIGDIFRQIALSEDISEEDKIKAFDKSVSLVQDFFGACQSRVDSFSLAQIKPVEEEKTIDLSGIEPWSSKEKSGTASEYLRDKYGHLLKRYNPDIDSDLICLQDLKSHDPKLYRGLYNESRETGINPSKYIASKPQRTKDEALVADIAQVQQAARESARLRAAIKKYCTPFKAL